MVDDSREFAQQRKKNIDNQGADSSLAISSKQWMNQSFNAKYSYNFDWLGRPIIQYPQDMLAVQELLWRIQPNVVIETGVARGGSMIYISSLLELIAMCGGPEDAQVIGIDIDIRQHNRTAIEQHPLAKRVKLIEGSSVSEDVFTQVKRCLKPDDRIMVFLDSNHTHEHVLKELELYAGLVSMGSYCVVFDTVIDSLAQVNFSDRPWEIGNSPNSAVKAFLEQNACGKQFEIDQDIDNKLLLSVAPQGYLKCIK